MGDINRNFKKGERVFAYYYHTWNLKHPANAKILFKHPRKAYHFFAAGKCDWYWILADGNKLPSLFPETCLQPIEEYINQTKNLLSYGEPLLGQKGYDWESYSQIKKQLEEAIKY